MEKELIHWAECSDFQTWVKNQPFRFGQAYVDVDDVDLILNSKQRYKHLKKADKKKVYLPFGLNDPIDFFLSLEEVKSVFHYQTPKKAKVKLVLGNGEEVITQGKTRSEAYTAALKQLIEGEIVG